MYAVDAHKLSAHFLGSYQQWIPHIVIAQLSSYLWSQRNLDLCTTSSSKSSASSYQQMLHHNDNILVTSHLWIKRNLDPGLSSLDLCTTSTPKSSASELSKLINPPQHFQTLGDNSEKNTSSQNRCIMLAGRRTPPCPTSSADRKCFTLRQNTPIPLIAVIWASPLNCFSHTNQILFQKIRIIAAAGASKVCFDLIFDFLRCRKIKATGCANAYFECIDRPS